MSGNRARSLSRSLLNQARTINIASGRISDRLSGANKNDFFRFTLTQRSSVSLSLKKLKANANLQLLDSNGQIVSTSARSGKSNEAITIGLAEGTYHVRVYSGGRGQVSNVQTPYRLRTAIAPAPSPNETPTPTTPINLQPAGSFRIQFDYRFDTQGWFTAERRAALETAARIWESIIADEFPDTPVGTATPYVLDPSTGDYVGGTIFTTDTAIDDLMIFVGTQDMGGSTLAVGAPSGHYSDESRYMGTKFEPWLGSMSFDRGTNWFFDATPATDDDIPQAGSDFISTAVHEIGHILGFTRSTNAFSNFVVNDTFVGPQTMAANGGNPLPLQPGSAHVRDGYEFGGSGEILMDPTSAGGRQLPTRLDAAVLADLGYTINPNAVFRNPTSNARTKGSPGSTISRCGCLSCLTSDLASHSIHQLAQVLTRS
jgi:hypothetical protein